MIFSKFFFALIAIETTDTERKKMKYILSFYVIVK